MNLHKYRKLEFDILLLENWVDKITIFERERKLPAIQTIKFLDQFCPHHEWKYFYSRYLDTSKMFAPTVKEKVKYFKEQGYTKGAIASFSGIAYMTVKKYYDTDQVPTRIYKYDPRLEELVGKWNQFKEVLPKEIFQGTLN